MAEAVIETKGLRKIYHLADIEVKALNGVDLRIERGEFVAIMGSSGSGKSTLMYILGCLDRSSEGEYRFEGTDVASLGEPELARLRSQRIGFVFQSFNLLARTPAIENVALPLFYSDATAADRTERMSRARQALGWIGLGQRERNHPSQLSGGQQQRVAIARALINNPSLLLADEPTGNLDSRTSDEIMRTLQALNREEGVTVVVVTHEADVAAYADRVITMKDGLIVSDERSKRVRGGPALGEASEKVHEIYAAPVSVPARPILSWTFLTMALSAAAQAIMRNKLRASLTMLGIFIGVAALIAMVAVGEGANYAVKQRIASLGTNMLVVVPGARTQRGVRGGFGSASTLTVTDAEAIRREDPAVVDVGYLLRGNNQVVYGNKNWQTNTYGVSPSYLPITNWRIASGRGLEEDDMKNYAMVTVIGQTIAKELYGDASPLGTVLLAKGKPLRVVGVLAPKGQSGFGYDQDDVILMPYTTAETKVLGVSAPTQPTTSSSSASTSQLNASGGPTGQSADTQYPAPLNPFGITSRLTGYVNTIYVQARSPEAVQAAIAQVTATLKRRHRIKPGDSDDFAVRNLSQIAEAAQGSSQVMALLLATVASISLVVGGIGIMNILLVSVTERTREIGLRMAIGARRVHILFQFLVEAVMLAVTGGVAGIVIGIAASRVISAVAEWPTLVSPAAIAGGFFFSAAVGIFFGFYPARKAAHLDPIEALRYE